MRQNFKIVKKIKINLYTFLKNEKVYNIIIVWYFLNLKKPILLYSTIYLYII